MPSKPKKDTKISKLLQCRELHGKIVEFSDRNGSFQEECKKKLASKPKVFSFALYVCINLYKKGTWSDANGDFAIIG